MNENPLNVERASITEIEGIGGVREHRLARDLEITTIREVSEASIDTLAEVWSIGELTAMRVKGRAQGLCNAYDAWVEERREKIRPDPDKPAGWTGKVAVLFGDITDDDGNLPENVEPEKLQQSVGDALDEANIVVDDDSEVGFVSFSEDEDFGEAGGLIVSKWIDSQVNGGLPPKHKRFETPWSKYSKWCDFGYTADFGQTFNDIPFDTPRGVEDVEAQMAPWERTREMVQWADEVVIPVDGEYTYRIRKEAERHNTPCTTFLELDRMNNFHPYSPAPEGEASEIDASEGISGKAGTTVKADDGTVQEEKVDEADWSNSRTPREGSPDELDPDMLETGVTVQDEHWPDDEETAGGGVGSGSDRKGEYQDKFIH